jgi:DNA gyrase inhibitor GyrI
MAKQELLHVGICNLEPVQVVQKLCIFRDQIRNYNKQIRQTFRVLREWVPQSGLNPNELLHIGIPSTNDRDLVTYDCCIEFPLPLQEDNSNLRVCTLCGGKYAVLTIEKTPAKIKKAIRQFRAAYIPDHRLVEDDARPVYEIYYETTMEYCVPILE